VTLDYLDALDKLLLMGVSQLTSDFTQRQAQFVAAKQFPDGGFAGRIGKADLYYTDFGVRLMRLLSVDDDTPKPTAQWLTALPMNNATILDCFSFLNTVRLLHDIGQDVPFEKPSLIASLRDQQLADGGFARSGVGVVSAYNTFIAALCFQMLDVDFPEAHKAVESIRRLRRPDGGYCETLGQSLSQANSTSAAVAFLTMQDALEPDAAEAAKGFLSSMQTSEGGLLAHPMAPEADLLSTFTGVLTLFGLNALDGLDLPGVARFAGVLAQPGGAFAARVGDDEPDIEYTYYGIGTLALLRAYVLAVETN
jgi:geranylgeranyl transferase type-2 subunit beta